MQQSLFNTDKNILPCLGEAILYPCFFSAGESDQYLGLLTNEIKWKQEPIKLFGKEMMQPRLTAWYGDADKKYSYSGITMQPQPWTQSLLQIKKRIETIARVNFTSALLNFYRDGNDSMGWHRDNEMELGINPVIGSVSFGAARTFQLRNYIEKDKAISVDLTHGSFLLMKEETQHHWEHRLPKTNKKIGSRINITFRVILPVPARGA
ncbi:MAG: alpha-ketoglutarate-dependent dioxygenase AlkB [Ferruginibacter sp.]|nr:alpha-ketoglutarate-dependent dioxygenase AlkB [Ferruginibacter sp.]